MALSTAPTAQVGNYYVHKTSATTYVLSTLAGVVVDTFPTARTANTHAVALITAAYLAAK